VYVRTVKVILLGDTADLDPICLFPLGCKSLYTISCAKSVRLGIHTISIGPCDPRPFPRPACPLPLVTLVPPPRERINARPRPTLFLLSARTMVAVTVPLSIFSSGFFFVELEGGRSWLDYGSGVVAGLRCDDRQNFSHITSPLPLLTDCLPIRNQSPRLIHSLLSAIPYS
jgi:hypothetical protein